jgi:hypothetical protein
MTDRQAQLTEWPARLAETLRPGEARRLLDAAQPTAELSDHQVARLHHRLHAPGEGGARGARRWALSAGALSGVVAALVLVVLWDVRSTPGPRQHAAATASLPARPPAAEPTVAASPARPSPDALEPVVPALPEDTAPGPRQLAGGHPWVMGPELHGARARTLGPSVVMDGAPAQGGAMEMAPPQLLEGALRVTAGQQALKLRAGGIDITGGPAAGFEVRVEIARIVIVASAGQVTVDRLAGSPLELTLGAAVEVPRGLEPARSPEGPATPPARADQEQPAAEARPAPARSPLVAEAELVGRAQRLLRRPGAAGASAALEVLDEHARRFPRPSLAAEAVVVRLDALLRLERRQQALAVLEPIRLEEHPRRRELHVLRGELLTSQRSWSLAVADFTSALRGDRSALEERALQGRARCLLLLGRATEARADLRDYLKRFPAGPFAVRAGAALAPADRAVP